MIDLLLLLLFPQIPMSHYDEIHKITFIQEGWVNGGEYNWTTNELTMFQFASKEMLAHEIGHAVDDKYGKSKIFGHYPYVSYYARTNSKEDFAETYREFYTGDKCKQFKFIKKCNEIRRIKD